MVYIRGGVSRSFKDTGSGGDRFELARFPPLDYRIVHEGSIGADFKLVSGAILAILCCASVFLVIRQKVGKRSQSANPWRFT